jgi:hypothetical protein
MVQDRISLQRTMILTIISHEGGKVEPASQDLGIRCVVRDTTRILTDAMSNVLNIAGTIHSQEQKTQP